ncbi:aspartyl protease family protein [Pontibacter sp. MBLB2868]|uniref:aspartyl protease family protein n=1 Tax=Pontibacter sp. MBLB2868 TaxID=3451555 RepID=UPI003F75252B
MRMIKKPCVPKKKVLLFLLFFISISSSFGQAKVLYDLYHRKDFPALSQIIADNSLLDGKTQKVYQATIYNAYGKAKKSSQLLKSVKVVPAKLSAKDTLSYVVLQTMYDNSIKLFDYKGAAQAGDLLLSTFREFYSPEEYQDEAEALRLWKLLSAVPAQQVEQVRGKEIQLKKDKAGLLNIPVQASGAVHDMVFDSGAGLSVLSESYAHQLGVTFVSDATIPVKSGITGLANPVKLAVAERLNVGGINVSNAVFLVFPDSSLSFGGGVYKINGIIGFPIISNFGTLTFTEQTKLTVNKENAKGNVKPNMIIDGLKPVIYLAFNGEELPYTFDTGAGRTKLSNNFYGRYKSIVEAKGALQDLQAEGTGGRVSLKGYELPEVTFFLSGKPIKLEKVFVSQESISTNGEIYFGNIGQDFIRQFQSMTISFDGAYVSFE